MTDQLHTWETLTLVPDLGVDRANRDDGEVATVLETVTDSLKRQGIGVQFSLLGMEPLHIKLGRNNSQVSLEELREQLRPLAKIGLHEGEIPKDDGQPIEGQPVPTYEELAQYCGTHTVLACSGVAGGPGGRPFTTKGRFAGPLTKGKQFVNGSEVEGDYFLLNDPRCGVFINRDNFKYRNVTVLNQ